MGGSSSSSSSSSSESRRRRSDTAISSHQGRRKTTTTMDDSFDPTFLTAVDILHGLLLGQCRNISILVPFLKKCCVFILGD